VRTICKRTDYALIALAHMAERPGRVCSAREIAQAYRLPLALLMKILKTLHHGGIVDSSRGVKGGYLIKADLAAISLFDLNRMIESGDGRMGQGRIATETFAPRTWPAAAPLQALHWGWLRFLQGMKVSELVTPGRRIDVPLEVLGIRDRQAIADRPLNSTTQPAAVPV
jgi:Rrf2 family protein